MNDNDHGKNNNDDDIKDNDNINLKSLDIFTSWLMTSKLFLIESSHLFHTEGPLYESPFSLMLVFRKGTLNLA